jgi:hypothetical protein
MRVQSESRAQSRRLAATPATFARGEGPRARLSKATEDTGEQSPRLDSNGRDCNQRDLCEGPDLSRTKVGRPVALLLATSSVRSSSGAFAGMSPPG